MTKRTALLGALIVSVSLNLLIAGVFIGRLGARAPGPPPGAWAARDLSQDSRQIVRQHMRRDVDAVRPLRAEMRAAREAIRAAVETEPFDPAALREALARLRLAGARYQEFLHENIVEVAVRLPAGERAALVRVALDRARPGDLERPPRHPAPGP